MYACLYRHRHPSIFLTKDFLLFPDPHLLSFRLSLLSRAFFRNSPNDLSKQPNATFPLVKYTRFRGSIPTSRLFHLFCRSTLDVYDLGLMQATVVLLDAFFSRKMYRRWTLEYSNLDNFRAKGTTRCTTTLPTVNLVISARLPLIAPTC